MTQERAPTYLVTLPWAEERGPPSSGFATPRPDTREGPPLLPQGRSLVFRYTPLLTQWAAPTILPSPFDTQGCCPLSCSLFRYTRLFDATRPLCMLHPPLRERTLPPILLHPLDTREGSPLSCFTPLDTRWGPLLVTQGRLSRPPYFVTSWGGRGAVLLHPSIDARARFATPPLDTRGGGPPIALNPSERVAIILSGLTKSFKGSL